MTFEFSSWQLVLLISMLVGALWGFGKVMLAQIDKHLVAQFKHLNAELSRHESRMTELDKAIQRVDRDVLKLQADMPLQYVRREDYVRNQTVIEAKLDAIALRVEHRQGFEHMQPRGDKQ